MQKPRIIEEQSWKQYSSRNIAHVKIYYKVWSVWSISLIEDVLIKSCLHWKLQILKMQSWKVLISYFYFLEKPCFILDVFIFFTLNESINFDNCDVKMSFSIAGSVNFWIVNQLVIKCGQLIDIVMVNFCNENFEWLRDLGPRFRPFLIYQTTIIKNQLGLD